MTDSCAFCDLAGNLPEHQWMLNHSQTGIVSFKPFGAVNSGHRLFVPTTHVVGVEDDPYITGLAFEEASRWAKAHPGPCNLVVNSGSVAGQGVFHLHVHYVPRNRDDGLGYRWKAEKDG